MKRRKRRKFILGLALATALGFIFDLGYFTAGLLPEPKGPEEVPGVDLIAVLTGGQGRIREAVEFLMDGVGEYLLISGTTQDATVEDILKANNAPLPTAELRKRIFLDTSARNTLENASEVAAFIERIRAGSVLLVTSTYHVRRARLLLEREIERRPELKGTQIYVYPVESPNFDRDFWWLSTTGWHVLLSEYLKFSRLRLGY